MKHIILMTIFITLCTLGVAQKGEKRISATVGLHMNTISYTNTDIIKRQTFNTVHPHYSLKYASQLNDNIFWQTGISYYSYSENIQNKNISKDGIHQSIFPLYLTDKLYDALSVPIGMGYRERLGQKFSVEYSLNVNIDLYFNASQGNSSNTIDNQSNTNTYLDNSLKTPINILLENGLSFTYHSKHKLSYSISTSYHSGLLNAWQHKKYTIYEQSNSEDKAYFSYAQSRGSYFLASIGIAYIFGNKEE